MALSEIDRKLLERLLDRQPNAWNDFVDRFMGLVIHVINYTADARGIHLSAADRDDLTAEVLLALLADDFAPLRRFRGQSSLATYLTVIARRVVVRDLLKNKQSGTTGSADGMATVPDGAASAEERLSDRDEVERLLEELEGAEAEVVRLYHLEGKSYAEISHTMGMAENSVGPTLSRARVKLRKAGESAKS